MMTTSAAEWARERVSGVVKRRARDGAWLIGTPLLVALAARAAGLWSEGASANGGAALVIVLCLTPAAGFVAPVLGSRPRADAWRSDLTRSIAPMLGFWAAAVIVGIGADHAESGSAHIARLLTWFTALFLFWGGAARLLGAFGIGPAPRILILGGLNLLASSSFFWSAGLLDNAGAESRRVLAEWLAAMNPLECAARELYGQSLLQFPLMYFQRLSPLAEQAAQPSAMSLWSALGLGAGTFAVSVAARAFRRA